MIKKDYLDINNLIRINESQYFDRKSASIKINKLVEAIVAFANANGGIIAIGIDNGNITGIKSQGNKKINDFIQAGFDYVIPSAKVSPVFIDVVNKSGEQDQVLLLEIDSSFDRVHKTTADEVFLRVGDQSKRLNFEQRLNLEYDKGERRFEDTIVEGASIDDLDFNLIKKYADVLGYEDYNYERLLLARGLARRMNGQIKLTNAAIILFAFNPTLFLPNARIRFIRYDGIKAEVGTEMNIIKNVVIEGAITEQIEKAKDILKGQLREFTMLNSNNGKFMTIPEYPEFAWLEGIVNAVTHRAYNIQGDDIKILMFDDRLEIISPGKFPNIVNKENIKDTRYSRNPRIARALTELGWVRELGEGVKRIYKEMNEFFLDEPIFNEPGFSVSLVLKNNILTRRERRLEKVNSFVDIKWDELSEYDKNVIEYLYSKGRITSKELSELIGKSTTYSRKILKQLENKNILKRVSTSKNDPQQYFVLIENR